MYRLPSWFISLNIPHSMVEHGYFAAGRKRLFCNTFWWFWALRSLHTALFVTHVPQSFVSSKRALSNEGSKVIYGWGPSLLRIVSITVSQDRYSIRKCGTSVISNKKWKKIQALENTADGDHLWLIQNNMSYFLQTVRRRPGLHEERQFHWLFPVLLAQNSKLFSGLPAEEELKDQRTAERNLLKFRC